MLKKWFATSAPKEKTDRNVTEKIQLIEGTFNSVEAADVLLSLVSYKIKFHSLQLLQLNEENLEARAFSEKRIQELKAAKNRITKLVLLSRNQGKELTIESSITIRVH